MAPRWPMVNNGPEHINEHATYLREACNQLQAASEGRQNQVPWNVVQTYIASTVTLIDKVLLQPALSELFQYIQDTAKCTQNIQRDITVIKCSTGLSTTQPNNTNFSGEGTPSPSWAQITARPQNTRLPPPPAPHGTPIHGTQNTVTAYKDRVVTVKLKDHGVAQQYREKPATWVKSQVEATIRNNSTTKSVKIVAAHQLKSGDIQIFTSSTAEATHLKQNKNWIKGLGERAEIIIPTYGVIAHGIPTKSINIKNQEATIQQILADNHTVIPKAKISYVGWLTKESTVKRASSIVLELTDPEMANAIIYAGMVWDGQIHQCQLYDRACRIKQCFRCYNYGHIGTQCNANQACGYCTERHETKHCSQKGREGFSPQCTVCKDTHTAWSNACPARKKEMERVEQAKRARKVYWHVPSKEHDTPPRTDTNTRSAESTQESRPITTRTAPIRRTRPATRRITSLIEDTIPEEPDTLENTETQQEPTPRSLEPREPEPQEPQETTTIRASSVPRTEDWATPEDSQELPQTIPIDPQILPTPENPLPTDPLEEEQPQQFEYPPIDIGGDDPDIMDADTWLNDLAGDIDPQWLQPVEGHQPASSPPTSLATDPRTANGTIFKACKCPEHQDIYHDWPIRNAKLTIARCMKTCMYCGMNFPSTPHLRRHLNCLKYTRRRNLEVPRVTRGQPSPSTPAWTAIPGYRTIRILDEETPTASSIAHATRSQSLANSTNGTQRQC